MDLPNLLLLAASDAERLGALSERLAGRLKSGSALDPGGVAATLAVTYGATEERFRRAVVCRSSEDGGESLRTLDPGRVVSGLKPADGDRAVVFLFPGDGSQHPRMGEGLYRSEPVFRQELDRAAEAIASRLDVDLRALLYPGPADERRAAARLAEPAVAHTALLTFEVALARLWIDRGVEPRAVLGYSLGELSAAVLAGVFTWESAIDLVVGRARLMEKTADGAMLSIAGSEDEVAGLLGEGVSLAAVNGPARTVVSGRLEAIAALAARLDGLGVEHRWVRVARGYHSRLLEPILGAYLGLVKAANPSRPRLPMLSCVVGGPADGEEVCCPGFWVRHTRDPIRFGPAIEHLLGDPSVALLEVGPGTVLSRMIGEIVRARGAGATPVPSCRHPLAQEPDEEAFYRALGALWVGGSRVDWRRLVDGRQPVELDLESAPRLPLEPPPPVESEGFAGVVVRIWSELLGTNRIGPDDTFLALGGDSLVGTRVLARLRAELGVDLPLRELLREGTPARIAARIGELRARGGGAAVEEEPLTPVARTGALPASFGQESLWLVEQIAGASAAYHIPLVLRLRGPLDVLALQSSLGAIVTRHESLRTRFEVRGGRPVQVVDPPAALPLPVVQIGEPVAGSAAGDGWRRAVRSELQRPFDLARTPMVRALLVRLEEDDHVLAMTLHHIASDGWSLHILLRELGGIYAALSRGEEPALVPLPIQYADYAVWQRRTLKGAALEQEIGFWRRELQEVAVLDLGTGTPRRPSRAGRGARIPVRLDTELVGKLSAVGLEGGATLFSVLLAGFQVLLARYSGQDDIVVGTPVAGRDQVATEELIGYFINTLALRGTVDPRHTFLEHLHHSARRTLTAFGHRRVPFDRVVEELRPGRETGRNPIYQVVFALQNRSLEPPDLPDLAVTLEEEQPEAAKFDLAVQLQRQGGEVVGHLEYAAGLFEHAAVQRMVSSFVRLLTAAAERPKLRVSDLPLLDPAEEGRLLRSQVGPVLAADSSHGGLASPEVRPVHRLLSEVARRAPGRVAVAGGGTTLTYGELAERAGALAERLRSELAGAEARVALCFRRSPELVVAALGVLQARGVYVPLDPDYPDERLAHMVKDAAIRVAVADESLAGRLRGVVERLVVLGGARAAGEHEGTGVIPPVEETVPSERLAYVIYTSGSTGMPKGVAVTHGGLSNLVAWHQAVYGIGPDDRTTLIASPSFDASVWETWPTLAAGASLHVPPQDVVVDPARLVPWLSEQGITVSFLPTPLAVSALERPWPPEAHLRLLLTGGDALRRRPGRRHPFLLVNHYGPTESTVVTTAGAVSLEEVAPDRPPSIGRPIANLGAHVLDGRSALVPRGVAGELFISGPGLARGYLGRPGLTAERFVPNPFPAAGAGGERLYRTGDRVRLLPDGRLEFLGRIDRQVKLRGFRIELGEVETALAGQPGVADAAVAVRAGASGEPVLVAYVVPAGEALDQLALREGLRRRLPGYMVPSVFVPLAALPVTPNGKLDREGLPEPAAETERYLEPLDGPVEEALGQIWRSVLGTDRVGAFSDFFELGGHSLAASRMTAQVRDAFRIEMALSTVLSNPVLADMAAAVEEILLGALETPDGAGSSAGLSAAALAPSPAGGMDA
jgi:amino acid adenylation domain-containing protein